MNRAILMGRLTADPEIREHTSGVSSTRFTVAVNRRFKDKETGETKADFINCVAWRQTAEFIAKYFKKGNMICVEGSIRTGSYKDRSHPDVTHYTTEIYVDNAEFCGSKNETGAQSREAEKHDDEPVDVGTLEEFQKIFDAENPPF